MNKCQKITLMGKSCKNRATVSGHCHIHCRKIVDGISRCTHVLFNGKICHTMIARGNRCHSHSDSLVQVAPEFMPLVLSSLITQYSELAPPTKEEALMFYRAENSKIKGINCLNPYIARTVLTTISFYSAEHHVFRNLYFRPFGQVILTKLQEYLKIDSHVLAGDYNLKWIPVIMEQIREDMKFPDDYGY